MLVLLGGNGMLFRLLKEGDKDLECGRDKIVCLVVKVSGDGKLVVYVDVKVKIGGGDGIFFVINDCGEVLLICSGGGLVEVYVIV